MNSNQNVEPASVAKKSGCWLPAIIRILMGLGFTIFGLNGFLNFMPPPKTLPQGVMDFMVAMIKTGYLFQLVAGTQLVVGILLLLNLFVPLALALIMPVLVNIIAFHLFLDPKGIWPGVVLMAFELYLAWAYRDAFRPMLAMKVKPR